MNTPNVDLEISLEQCKSESKQKVVTPNVINSIYMIGQIDTKLVEKEILHQPFAGIRYMEYKKSDKVTNNSNVKRMF